MVDELWLDDEATVRIFNDPLHQRMLAALEDHGPQTSASLARILGDEAARLHYHLRRLEGVGLIELDHEEQIKGIRARYLRPAARGYRIAPEVLGAHPGLSEGLVAVARTHFDEAVDRLSRAVRARVEAPEPDRPRGSLVLDFRNLRLTGPEAEALGKEVQEVLRRWEARQTDPSGEAEAVSWMVGYFQTPKLP